MAKAAIASLIALGSLSALAIAGRFAYFRTYSFMSAIDDEGYILQSIQSYLQGQRLFDDVFSQYGPAFYALEYVVHGILRAPLTHDFERLVVVGVWVGTTAICGLIVFRLSRSWIGALVTFVAVFVHLTPLINEPAHPQVPLVLAISLVCLAATSVREDGSPAALAGAALLTAFAILTKVNVGAYLLLAVMLGTTLVSVPARFPFGHAVTAVVLAVGCALPLLVTRAHLDGWARNYALIVAGSLASTVFVIIRSRRIQLPVRTLLTYVTGVVAASVAFVLLALVQGSSVAALIQGTVVGPAQFAEVFAMPLLLPDGGVIAAGAGLLLCLGLTTRYMATRPWTLWIIVGAKLLVAAGALPLARMTYPTLIAYMTPLLWVVALAPAGSPLSRQVPARGILALIAVLQSLQAYPVAGTQLCFATFLILPIGFICALDAAALLSGTIRRPQIWFRAFELTLLVTVWIGYKPLLAPLPWRFAYDVQYDLRLPGAQRVRLPAPDVARYQWLSGTAAANCRSLVTLPGLYSLHFWSGIAPVNSRNATTWMTLLTESEQQSIWRAVDAAERPCAILNESLAMNWLAGRPLSSLPAYTALMDRFATVATLDGYQFMLPRRETRSPMMRLVAGRQAFERRRPPLPVAAMFAAAPPVSTLRTWFRTDRNGVVLGCQSGDRWARSATKWLPMLYVGSSGRLYGQHWTATFTVQAAPNPVNDGQWHHVALVRNGDDQRFYVDGRLAGSLNVPIDHQDLRFCQTGIGITEGWPDGPQGWMTFNGEVDAVDVEMRAWSAEEIERDWLRTRPND